jgi:hypothetical protein
MLLLTTTTDKIQLVTSAIATVDVHCSFMDYNGTTVTPGRQNQAINSATTTDIVAAPGSGVQRNVKTIHVRNKAGSGSVDVTVVFDQGGTDFELCKKTLNAGEELQYVEGAGFFKTTDLTPNIRTKKLTSDQSNSTATPTEVTGLSLTTGLGTFAFEYYVLYQSSATTNGVRLSVNHSGTVTSFVANVLFGGTSGASSDASPDQDQVLAACAIYNCFTARAKSTAGWGTTILVDTANADMLTMIDGLLTVTVDGDIELWHGSEGAVASTVKAGTSLVLKRTGD